MANVLLTGGAGFFGGILKHRLLEQGDTCVSIDLLKDETVHENLIPVQGDIRDRELLDRLFREYRFEVVYHCAAMLAHDVKDQKFLWESNVEGTRNLGELASQHSVRNLVFISSNCLYSTHFDKLVTEDEPPAPMEVYGRSKLEGEKIVQGINVCPETVAPGSLPDADDRQQLRVRHVPDQGDPGLETDADKPGDALQRVHVLCREPGRTGRQDVSAHRKPAEMGIIRLLKWIS